MNNLRISLLVFSTCAVALSACSGSGIKSEAKYPTGAARDGTDANAIYDKPASIMGEGGLFGLNKKKEGEDLSGITVNAYLWRAALDTVSFMPLASADPFGGVILTDYYTDENAPNERFKLNVFVLSKQLKSDGIQVRVFKQVRGKGGWNDVEAPAEMARQLEDSILTRARQLRVANLDD